jgi:hypothetical protein
MAFYRCRDFEGLIQLIELSTVRLIRHHQSTRLKFSFFARWSIEFLTKTTLSITTIITTSQQHHHTHHHRTFIEAIAILTTLY